jgi:hypothetical protein
LVRVHCGPTALPTKADNGHVGRAKGSAGTCLRWAGWADPPGRVVDEAVAYRHRAVLSVASRARAVGLSRPCEDAAAHSPGVGAGPDGHAIGTADASGRHDSRRCGLGRRCAGCRPSLDGAPGERVSCLQGNRRSHLAGERSPFPRSARLSRLPRRRAAHSPVQAPALLEVWREQVRTRWCAAAPV